MLLHVFIGFKLNNGAFLIVITFQIAILLNQDNHMLLILIWVAYDISWLQTNVNKKENVIYVQDSLIFSNEGSSRVCMGHHWFKYKNLSW